jgi:hypothetical protein
MTDRPSAHVGLLHQRLALIANLSALTAGALKLTQTLAGIEMDILRLEMEIDKNGASEHLVRELREVEGKAEAIRAAQLRSDATIAEAENAVAVVDGLLSAKNDI